MGRALVARAGGMMRSLELALVARASGMMRSLELAFSGSR
jgi:hypothetical protein